MTSRFTGIIKRRWLRGAGLIITLFAVTVIGTRLWGNYVEVSISRLGRSALVLAARVVPGYVDLLHHNIGKGTPDQYLEGPFTIYSMFWILGPLLLIAWLRKSIKIQRRRVRAGQEKEHALTEGESGKGSPGHAARLDLLKRASLWCLLPLWIIMAADKTSDYFEAKYVRKASTWVERSIEILAPHLEHQVILELRADYRAIDDAATFYALERRIKSAGEKVGAHLPWFASIQKRNPIDR